LATFLNFLLVDTVKALRPKPEGQGLFDYCWSHWDFSLTYSFQPHCGPRVDSVSNRKKYHGYLLGGKGSQCVGLTTLLPPCADCLRACPGHYRDSFALLFQSEKCSWYTALMCATWKRTMIILNVRYTLFL